MVMQAIKGEIYEEVAKLANSHNVTNVKMDGRVAEAHERRDAIRGEINDVMDNWRQKETWLRNEVESLRKQADIYEATAILIQSSVLTGDHREMEETIMNDREA